MELLICLLLLGVLGKWTIDALRRNLARDAHPAPADPDDRAKPSSRSGAPDISPPTSRTQTRYEALQRERSWSTHRIAAARSRPTEVSDLLRKLDQMAALRSFWRRTKQTEILESYAVWRRYDLEIERQLRRGPETDEERTFDAAARSVAEIERDLAALPATAVTVQEIVAPEAGVLDMPAAVRFRVSCGKYRWGKGYMLYPSLDQEPNPYGSRTDSISRAKHACLISSIELREEQYYDWVMRSGREHTHYAWSIAASQALHDALVSAILGEMTAEEREKLEMDRLYTVETAAFLDVPTSLPTGMVGRKCSAP